MNSNFAYMIDKYEVRLKSAKAAYDWEETAHIFNELQKLYALQSAAKFPS